MSPAEAQRITGRCLCAAVRFEIDGRLGPAIYCHCSQCRRASGSAFATNASVRARYLRFTSGRDVIREYESTPGKFRAFCSRCGSPVYSRLASDPESFRIRLGTLDGDPGRRPLWHFWVGSKAVWHAITDALPQYMGDAPAATGRATRAERLVVRGEARVGLRRDRRRPHAGLRPPGRSRSRARAAARGASLPRARRRAGERRHAGAHRRPHRLQPCRDRRRQPARVSGSDRWRSSLRSRGVASARR